MIVQLFIFPYDFFFIYLLFHALNCFVVTVRAKFGNFAERSKLF